MNLLDQCRSSEEVWVLLKQDHDQERLHVTSGGELPRVRLAADFNEKEVRTLYRNSERCKSCHLEMRCTSCISNYQALNLLFSWLHVHVLKHSTISGDWCGDIDCEVIHVLSVCNASKLPKSFAKPVEPGQFLYLQDVILAKIYVFHH